MMALQVVDVGQEIAFDVEHYLQLWSTVQSLLGQRRLSNQRDRLWQIAIDMVVAGRRPVMPYNLTQRFKPCLCRSVKDEVDRTRMRIKQNQWMGCGVHIVAFPGFE